MHEGGDILNVQSRISGYIKDMGITQASICKKTGIRPDVMSATLSCKRKMTADEFEMICRAIDKSPDDFMVLDKEEA